MAAYARPIKCVCGNTVSMQVFDAFGMSRGYWCKACAEKYVAEINGRPAPAAVPPDDAVGAVKSFTSSLRKRTAKPPKPQRPRK